MLRTFVKIRDPGHDVTWPGAAGLAMVQLTVTSTATRGRAHQPIDALHMLMRRAQQARGCSGAHLAADLYGPDAIWYVEDWQDPRALDARLRSDDASQLLALIETSVKPPSLEFRMIEQSRGTTSRRRA